MLKSIERWILAFEQLKNYGTTNDHKKIAA